jgi:hypothetical protein
MRRLAFFLSLFLLSVKLSANPMQLGSMASSLPKSVEVNNRLLANIDGEPITVYDVTKYMDIVMWKQYPEAFDSPQLRYQFYTANWKYYLKDLIERALLLQEAKKMRITVSNGDVRQELENLYGPNIVANLKKMGQSLKEVEESTRKQLMMQRLLGYKVHQPSYKYTTPKRVKELYAEYAENHQRDGFFEYRVISLRSADAAKIPFVAAVAYHLLEEENVAIDNLKEALQLQGLLTSALKLSISELFHHTTSQMSEQYKTILSGMDPGSYSHPQSQKDKEGGGIYRIFYLKEKQLPGPIPFEEAEAEIKKQILSEKFEEYTLKYMQEVANSHHVNVDEILKQIPENFTPYILK